MNQRQLKQIFKDTDYVHVSGSEEELRVAEYLKAQCEALGAKAWLEAFPVAMGDVGETVLLADGEEIPCKGLACCGSGTVEGELYYMPGQDRVSIAGAKDKIVLLDTLGINFFLYHDLVAAGAKGLLFQYGNRIYPNKDIDRRDLRPHVVADDKKLLSGMLNAGTAMELVRRGARHVSLTVKQREYMGESHNVVAELPGRCGEWIVLSAHYDSTSLSHGSYDNMSGCAALLGVLEALRGKEHNYGLRFIFCGSEERGLLGSKAYARDHEAELDKLALDINLDMVGSIMGKFIACVSAEEKLAHYIEYMGAELSFPVSTRIGVYSSDSTAFADKGVPSLSMARHASDKVAPIHGRYDRMDVLSMAQLQQDIAFIAEFTRRMADAAVCPVSREIPDKVKKDLDEYLFRKRKSVQ